MPWRDGMMARGHWQADWLHQARHPSRPRVFLRFGQVVWQESPDWENHGSWTLIKILKGRLAEKKPATLCHEATHDIKLGIITIQGNPVIWRI